MALAQRFTHGDDDRDLNINERTVKLHRTAITTKLEVRSVAELTRLVQAAGAFEEQGQ